MVPRDWSCPPLLDLHLYTIFPCICMLMAFSNPMFATAGGRDSATPGSCNEPEVPLVSMPVTSVSLSEGDSIQCTNPPPTSDEGQKILFTTPRLNQDNSTPDGRNFAMNEWRNPECWMIGPHLFNWLLLKIVHACQNCFVTPFYRSKREEMKEESDNSARDSIFKSCRACVKKQVMCCKFCSCM